MSHLEDWKAVIAKPRAQALIALAIDEDLGDEHDDATTRAIFPDPAPAVASLVARSETVVCGLALIEEIVTRFDRKAKVSLKVNDGGGMNHREGLFDGVMIKDNHIAAAGSISDAVAAARRSAGPGIFVEVEVDTLKQLEEALLAEPDLILIDNFSLEDTRTAVERSAGRIPLEASGGMREERIAAVAGTGVDRISMGAITHSALPADLALDFPGSPR